MHTIARSVRPSGGPRSRGRLRSRCCGRRLDVRMEEGVEQRHLLCVAALGGAVQRRSPVLRPATRSFARAARAPADIATSTRTLLAARQSACASSSRLTMDFLPFVAAYIRGVHSVCICSAGSVHSTTHHISHNTTAQHAHTLSLTHAHKYISNADMRTCMHIHTQRHTCTCSAIACARATQEAEQRIGADIVACIDVG